MIINDEYPRITLDNHNECHLENNEAIVLPLFTKNPPPGSVFEIVGNCKGFMRHPTFVLFEYAAHCHKYRGQRMTLLNFHGDGMGFYFKVGCGETVISLVADIFKQWANLKNSWSHDCGYKLKCEYLDNDTICSLFVCRRDYTKKNNTPYRRRRHDNMYLPVNDLTK